MMTWDTKTLKKLDLQHNMHPFMKFDKEREIIVEGKGAYVFDSDNKKYLDGVAGLWCVNVGYGRKELVDVMTEQAMKLPYYSSFVVFSNLPSTLLAKKLTEIAPNNLKHVYFTLGGSEANDFTVRMIHQYNNLRKKKYKKQIISRKSAYHGMTYMAASISGIPYNNLGYDTVKDLIHHVSAPNVFRKPEKGMDNHQYVDWLADEFEKKVLEIGDQNVAAFFAEPIMGAGGVFVAPAGYHKRIWNICKKYDILYVSDEVVTAFGRLGEFFASEKCFDIRPDIINVAKGITSGYMPLAATLMTDEIFNTLKTGNFTTGYTYSGHPVSTAVGLKNIELMDQEGIGDNVKKVSVYFHQKLNELKKYQILGDVRGSHFMIGLEYVKNNVTMEDFANAEEAKPGNRIAEKCYANGVIIRPLGDCLSVISPPLIWTNEHVDEFISVLGSAIKETMDELTKEKHI